VSLGHAMNILLTEHLARANDVREQSH
jgi:hypothetical protein